MREMGVLNSKRIAQAAQMACLLEVSADKPGNINRTHDFADSRYEDYLLSAVAIGPAMEGAGQAPVGRTIWRAVRDTRRVAPSNTNLGMILLLAPLAKAAYQLGKSGLAGAGPLRERAAGVLSALTVEDARLAYKAIRLAKAGGLGRVPQADVAGEPEITLYEAMRLARDHDSVAREYATGYSITFDIGYPALGAFYRTGSDRSAAIVQTYLTILAAVPDTLIARKRGAAAAAEVSQKAAEVLEAGGVFTPRGRKAVEELDRYLRDERHTLNPGTTADLVTAAIFVHLLFDR